MEYTLIDLNGRVHEAIPEMLKDRLLKKGWAYVGESGEPLQPTLPEVAEFIAASQQEEKKSDIVDIAEVATNEQPEVIEFEQQFSEPVKAEKKIAKKQVRRAKK